MNIAFDLGANKGSYARAIARDYARIVCVEANPRIIPQLKDNLRDHEHVVIENYILGERSNEQRTLYINQKNDALSSTSENWVRTGRFSPTGAFPILGHFSETVTVPTITIDDLIAKHGKPRFIKLDVESDEHRVLRGLSAVVDELSFEWHEEVLDDVRASIQRLVSLGYQRFGACDFDASGEQHHQRPKPAYTAREVASLFVYLEQRNTQPWRKRWGMIWCFAQA